MSINEYHPQPEGDRLGAYSGKKLQRGFKSFHFVEVTTLSFI